MRLAQSVVPRDTSHPSLADRRSIIAGALLLACLASLGRAQGFGIGPSVGYYRPFRDFAPASVYASDLPTTTSQLAAPTWGLDAYLGLRARWRLRGFVSTASSKLPPFASPGGGGITQTRERVTLATLEAEYALVQPSANTRVLVSAGAATIQHGGEGYSRYGSPRSWGATIGLEFEHALSRHVQLAAAARAISYSFNLNSPPEHGRQFDGVFTLGVRWYREGHAASHLHALPGRS